MSEKVPMTKEGHDKLHEELNRLKKEERPAIIKAIAIARAHGDLSENAEYHAAKEKQSFIEGRIQLIEDKLVRAQVIDTSTVPRDKIAFGVTASLSNLETDEEVKYQLVGVDEADVENGRVSITSPIARALLRKEIGDTVIVNTPGGKMEYEILDIE